MEAHSCLFSSCMAPTLLFKSKLLAFLWSLVPPISQDVEWLYTFEFKSSVFVAMQYLHLLLYNPPRFYILLLLLFILLVILIKAGMFHENAQCASMYENCEGKPIASRSPGFEVCAVDVPGALEVNEEIETGKDEGIGTVVAVAENSDECERDSCEWITKEPSSITKQEDKAGEEDVNELHERVEAYIRKVRTRLHMEQRERH